MQHSIDHERMTKLSATTRPMPSRLDHIVIGADQLESGTRWTEARLQSAMDGGGAHPLMSTHNRVMRLSGGPYLEVIAIDPAAPSPGRPRWFTLDDRATKRRLAGGPAALCWVASVQDIEKSAATCGYDCGRIIEVSRGAFRGRLTVPDDGSLPEQGILPSLIEWPDGMHPIANLAETGISLDAIQLTHPDPAYISDCLGRLGLQHLADIAAGDVAIAFRFSSQDGPVTIT